MVAAVGCANASSGSDVLALENLVPWEIQWYADGIEIEPDARARMVKAKGLRRYALQYHVQLAEKCDAEITAFQRHGIEITAVYFWLNFDQPGADPKIQAAFESFKRHGIRPQIWVSQSTAFLPKSGDGMVQLLAKMGFDWPPGYTFERALKAALSTDDALTPEQKERFFEALHRAYWDEENLPKTSEERAQRLERESQRIASLAKLASQYGLDVLLYNHEGWFGVMDNQLAIIDRLEREGINNVGMIYTFWHARDRFHDDVREFEKVWTRIRPRVAAVGLSGVRGEMEGLYPSQGNDELRMMRVVQESGWKGPVAVLGLNFSVGPEKVLGDMLRGTSWLRSELRQAGSGGARPFSRDVDSESTMPQSR
ncbi:hypothetical protein ACFPN2_28070 [Steroidobacter flavus]|uniref:Uncharacterized protein n=1 Tax=Steroidobacter flavus TaxID=1842136 RepID=A0ABV8SZB8_9GAMM